MGGNETEPPPMTGLIYLAKTVLKVGNSRTLCPMVRTRRRPQSLPPGGNFRISPVADPLWRSPLAPLPGLLGPGVASAWRQATAFCNGRLRALGSLHRLRISCTAVGGKTRDSSAGGTRRSLPSQPKAAVRPQHNSIWL